MSDSDSRKYLSCGFGGEGIRNHIYHTFFVELLYVEQICIFVPPPTLTFSHPASVGLRTLRVFQNRARRHTESAE